MALHTLHSESKTVTFIVKGDIVRVRVVDLEEGRPTSADYSKEEARALYASYKAKGYAVP